MRYYGTLAKIREADDILWRRSCAYSIAAGLRTLHPDTPDHAAWSTFIGAGNPTATMPDSDPWIVERRDGVLDTSALPLKSWSNIAYDEDGDEYFVPDMTDFVAYEFTGPNFPNGDQTVVFNGLTIAAVVAAVEAEVTAKTGLTPS